MSVQCAECGRFLGVADFEAGYCAYTPETEFGHERIEWECLKCIRARVSTATAKDKIAAMRQSP